MPILFKFSIASVLAAREKPESVTSSKHPFTVKVSNPNVLLKTNLSDSENILMSASDVHCCKESENISNLMFISKSVIRITTGLNAEIGDKYLTSRINHLVLFLKILFV